MDDKALIALLEAALPEVPEDREGAYMQRDIREATGWAEEKVSTTLRELVGSGAWECVKIPRRTLDGSVRRLPHYRPKPPGG